MATGKLSYNEARLTGIRTWLKTIWIRNRDSDKTASSVAKKNPKKSIPLPLGVREPAQSWRLRFLTVIFSQDLSGALLIRPTELALGLVQANTDVC